MITTANELFDSIKGNFEVFSIVNDEALTDKKMTFSEAWDELETLAYCAGGVCNGMDVRRV